MKIENNKIVECSEDELFGHYLKAGFDEIMSFDDYRQSCEKNGTKVIPKGQVKIATLLDIVNKLKEERFREYIPMVVHMLKDPMYEIYVRRIYEYFDR